MPQSIDRGLEVLSVWYGWLWMRFAPKQLRAFIVNAVFNLQSLKDRGGELEAKLEEPDRQDVVELRARLQQLENRV